MVQHFLALDSLKETLELLFGVGVRGRRLDVVRVEPQHQFRAIQRHLKRLLPATAVYNRQRVDGEQLDVYPRRRQVDNIIAEFEVTAGEAMPAQ